MRTAFLLLGVAGFLFALGEEVAAGFTVFVAAVVGAFGD